MLTVMQSALPAAAFSASPGGGIAIHFDHTPIHVYEAVLDALAALYQGLSAIAPSLGEPDLLAYAASQYSQHMPARYYLLNRLEATLGDQLFAAQTA